MAPYTGLFDHINKDGKERDISLDDKSFGEVVVKALKDHSSIPPAGKIKLNTILQGNLSEFIIWDIGERYWLLYEKRFTLPANADYPWKNNSEAGIDILALPRDSVATLLAIEVKSSDGPGDNLITGGKSSLQNDFNGFYKGAVSTRVYISVSKLLFTLRYYHGRPDLEESVKSAVGKSPSESKGLLIIGTLLCNCGTEKDKDARERGFGRLADWLVKQGWDSKQFGFRVIEIDNVGVFLKRVTEDATK